MNKTILLYPFLKVHGLFEDKKNRIKYFDFYSKKNSNLKVETTPQKQSFFAGNNKGYRLSNRTYYKTSIHKFEPFKIENVKTKGLTFKGLSLFNNLFLKLLF